MKKNYFAPESEVVELKLQGFLCGSADIEDGTPIDMGGTDNNEDDGL
jgi:hypothetical protein